MAKKATEQETEKKINNGGITDEQIQMWKNKHRKISVIEIEDGDETHACYVRRPDMDTFAAVSKLGKTDEIKAANALFENCWLGGSQMLRDDAVLKMAVIGQLNKVMDVARAEIKNL